MKYIQELIEIGMGSGIDISIDKIVMEDEIYTKDIEDADEILDKLTDTLSEKQKNLLNDYIACMKSANERICNLSYLAGAKNTIDFLTETNFLKGDSE